MRKPSTAFRLILGALALAVAAFAVPLSFAMPFAPLLSPGTPLSSMLFLLLPALISLIVGVILWISAIRSVDGDDIFSGERGQLLSLMIAITVMIGAGAFYFLIQRDFWRGFFAGLAD